jgi:hypothetical protein
VSRILGIAVSFLVSLALLGWLIAARLGAEAVEQGTQLYQYRWYFAHVFDDATARERPLVVWLGDSTIMGAKRPSYPQLLRQQLDRKNADSKIIAGAAFDAYVYYFIVGRVIERLDPSVVVMVAHLSAFAPRGSVAQFRYNDLSSYLEPSELPRSFLLPLAERQLSPARVLLAQTLGWTPAQQVFLGAEGMRLLYTEAPFWEVLGPSKPPPVFNPALREALGDYNIRLTRRQPTVQMLEAAVRVVTESGRTALVVGTPIPYEAMATRSWYDAAVIQQRFDVLREAVEDAGGMFVDLHGLLRQDEFADYGGHFADTGARHVTDAVWPFVREALRRSALAHDGGSPRQADG